MKAVDKEFHVLISQAFPLEEGFGNLCDGMNIRDFQVCPQCPVTIPVQTRVQ